MQDVHYSPCSLRLVLMGFAFQQGGVKPEHDRQGELLLPRRTACGNGTRDQRDRGEPRSRGEPGCSSEVERGSNPVSSEAVGGCAQALEAPKRGQVPPRGLRSWLCQSIAAPRNSRLQALLKGSAGTRGFNCTLGILFSARPGIIYKNRKQKKQGERKNIKGLLNFHAAFEQAAFWIGSQPGASGKRAGAGS